MARFYRIDASDQIEYDWLIHRLRKTRMELGWTLDQVGKMLGKTEHFVHDIEVSRRDSPKLSRLQTLASAYDLRIEPSFLNLNLFAINDSEFKMAWSMSRPFDATEYLGMWIPAALRVWRTKRNISVQKVADAMGITADAVARWEKDAADPTIKRVFAQARVMGTALKLDLFHRDEWVYW